MNFRNRTLKRLRIALLHAGALSMGFTSLSGAVLAQDTKPTPRRRVSVSHKTDPVLHTVTFKTPEGQIRVSLPADMRPGDALMGAARLEPKGRQETDRESNRTRLRAYTLSLAGQSQPVQESVQRWNLPANLKGEDFLLTLSDSSQQEVARKALPLQTLPVTGSTPAPNPERIRLPAKGKTGRPIVFNQAFPSGTDDLHVLVGDKEAPLLAASPRLYVVESPGDVEGKTTLQVKRGSDLIAEGDFRNDRVHSSNPWGFLLGAAVVIGIVLAISANNAAHDIQNAFHPPF